MLFLYIFSFYIAYKIKKLDFLIYATIFSFFFEILNVLSFLQNSFGYIYSSGFLMYVFNVPLFIILAWGILFLGAYLVSLRLRMSKISRVLFIPVFITLVDFVIEGVSVNLGYWVWLGAEGGRELFSSIVASNFVGWLGVSLGFILCYEYLERKWLSMFLGYLVFMFLEFAFFSLNWVLGFVGNEEYMSLGVILFCFIASWFYFYHKNKILNRNKKDFKVDFGHAKYIVFMRGFFYLFALFYFFWDKYYSDLVYTIVLVFVVFMEMYFFLRFNGFIKKKV